MTIGLTMAALVAYVATATFVVQDGYGGSPQLFAGLFGLNALLMIVGNQVNAHLLPRYGPRRLIGFGLSLLLVAAVGLVVVGLGDLDLSRWRLASRPCSRAGASCRATSSPWRCRSSGHRRRRLGADRPGAVRGCRRRRAPGRARNDGLVLPLAIVTLTCAVAAGTASFVLIGPGRPKTPAAECELSAA